MAPLQVSVLGMAVKTILFKTIQLFGWSWTSYEIKRATFYSVLTGLPSLVGIYSLKVDLTFELVLLCMVVHHGAHVNLFFIV